MWVFAKDFLISKKSRKVTVENFLACNKTMEEIIKHLIIDCENFIELRKETGLEKIVRIYEKMRENFQE